MTLTVWHRCQYPRTTAGERLTEARFIKHMQNDRYAGLRIRVEGHYQRLVRIKRGPGPPRHTNYAATGGSGYNAKKRADILAHAFDNRRIRLVRVRPFKKDHT
jgi:hypothetical protein